MTLTDSVDFFGEVLGMKTAYVDIVCQHAAFRHYLNDTDLQEIGEFTRENVTRFSNSRNRPYGWAEYTPVLESTQSATTLTSRGLMKTYKKSGCDTSRRDEINGRRRRSSVDFERNAK